MGIIIVCVCVCWGGDRQFFVVYGAYIYMQFCTCMVCEFHDFKSIMKHLYLYMLIIHMHAYA